MPNPTRVISSAQRVANAVNRANQINQPTYCKECGSVYFIESQASMYSPAGSGFRGISTTPMKVYTCLCGKVQLHPGYNAAAPAGTERAFFGEALTAAANAQAARSLDKIAEGTVSMAEYRRLKDALNDLIERFNVFTAGGSVEMVDPVDVSEPAEEFDEGGPANVYPGGGSVVTRESDEENLGSLPPVASGNRGRSAASASPTSTDGIHWVEANNRPAVAGGARARMKRQGA